MMQCTFLMHILRANLLSVGHSVDVTSTPAHKSFANTPWTLAYQCYQYYYQAAASATTTNNTTDNRILLRR